MKRRSRPRAAKYRSYARKAAVFAILLCVVLLFTWSYVRSAFLGAAISVGRGEAGTLEDKVSGDAVFAGGSVIVTAPAAGSLRFLVKDKESVRTGQVIAEVGGEATAQAFRDSLSYAENRLADYEKATESEFKNLLSRIEPAYEKAVDLFFRVRKAYASADMASARAEEQKLREIGAGISRDRLRLLTIEEERARLTANVASIAAARKASTVQVLAPASGVFSSQVAQVESKLTLNALAGKDASQLLALAREAKETQTATVKDGQKVSTGDPVGRIVSGQKVSFFLPVKTEDKPDVKSGRQVSISFASSGLTEDAVIVDVQDGKPPGYSVIAGEIPMMPADAVACVGTVSLIVTSRSGIVIPRSAILSKEGRTGVLLVQKTYARFSPVEVLMTKGDKAVVRGISAGDELVARALKFLEGKRVR